MIFLLVTRQDNDLEVEIKERRRKKENGGGLLPVAASNRAPRNEKRGASRETPREGDIVSLPFNFTSLSRTTPPPYNLTGKRNFPKILEIPRSCVSSGKRGRRTAEGR